MSDTARRHANVIHIDECPSGTRGAGTRFGATFRRLAKPAGGQKIGCTAYEVAPGRSAMPAHFHCGNEEAIFVLAGTGTLHIGGDRVAVGEGDWASLPIGPEHAHRLENTGSETLRYLCISTMSTAEVVGYPDSKKVAALAGPDGGGPGSQPWVALWVKDDAGVSYFEGEDIG